MSIVHRRLRGAEVIIQKAVFSGKRAAVDGQLGPVVKQPPVLLCKDPVVDGGGAYRDPVVRILLQTVPQGPCVRAAGEKLAAVDGQRAAIVVYGGRGVAGGGIAAAGDGGRAPAIDLDRRRIITLRRRHRQIIQLNVRPVLDQNALVQLVKDTAATTCNPG